jgi:hypothetical protein
MAYTPPLRAEGTAAVFNMGISTLMRIDQILKEITHVSAEPMIPKEMKQAMKINLVKELFVQSSPLLNEEVVNKYQPQFNKLKPVESNIGYGRSGVIKKREKKQIYSEELNTELDRLSLEIQRELQKEKYFMPPKSDPRSGWKLE